MQIPPPSKRKRAKPVVPNAVDASVRSKKEELLRERDDLLTEIALLKQAKEQVASEGAAPSRPPAPIVKLTPDIIHLGAGKSLQEVMQNRRGGEEEPPNVAYPRKIIFRNFQSPGDVTMMTAAIRELHTAHPNKFITDVRTSCPALWEHNPYITKLNENDPEVEMLTAEYPLIQQSNTAPFHFIHGFTQHLEELLKVRIRPKLFKGDIHIGKEEKTWISQMEEMGVKDDYWIIVAGGKWDFTAKWWNPDFYQEVVDYFAGKILFVQTGESSHFHPPLTNVINLIGKTDLRKFIRLVYHSVGILCPVTFAMHAAAAIPTKPNKPPNRACVVVAGGREPAQWEAYPHHRFLSLNGSMDCCAIGGCWKSRCQQVGDGDEKDQKDKCLYPVQIKPDLRIARCMNNIKAKDVIRAIETYYEGGALKYGVSAKALSLLKEQEK